MARISLGTLTADGQTSAINWYNSRQEQPNRGTFHAFGTFGGGTVTIEGSPDRGTTWYQLGTNTLSANGAFNFEVYSGDKNNDHLQLRGAINGSTAPTVELVIFDSK